MMIPSTHASLLFALQRADHREEAWAGFHARYRDVILGWCRRQGFRPDAAEDLTQDVLLKLFRELPRHTHDPARGLFRSWLKAVVHNALADFRRRRQNHPSPSGLGGTAFLEQVARLEAPASADELTDTIIRRFCDIEPPSFLVLSATRLLPLPTAPIGPQDRQRLARQVRDMEWNPQRHLDLTQRAALRTVIDEKQALIDQEPVDTAARRQRFAPGSRR